MTPTPPDWITAAHAAEQCGYNAEYVRRLARQGKVSARKIPGGREWQIDLESLRIHQAVHGRAPKGSGSKERDANDGQQR